MYVAIPKTGSTTIRTQLLQRGAPLVPYAHLNYQQLTECLYMYNLLTALGSNDTFPHSKVPSNDEIRVASRRQSDSMFKFATVRNPWARAVSLYCRHEGVQVRNTMSFEQFCQQHLLASDTCRQPTLHRGQRDWLVDESGKMRMDLVIRIEELHEGLQALSHRTGGRIRLMPTHKNPSQVGSGRNYRDFYNTQTRRHIASVFAEDIETFKYQF